MRSTQVVIFAGYKKRIDELIEFNEGLPSRFRHEWDFPDFDERELTDILRAQLKSKKKYKVDDDKHVRIAARRLARQRGTTGFGNARAVRNYLESALERLDARIVDSRAKGEAPNIFLLTREDLLGPRTLTFETLPALKDLEDMVGLDTVKENIEQLLQLIATNAEREENEQPIQDVALNRLFLGNPGASVVVVDESGRN